MSRRVPGDGQLTFDLDEAAQSPEPPGPRAAPSPLGSLTDVLAPRFSAEEIAVRLGRPRPTDEQAAVIEAPLEPLLVVAGAGSGKTETMAARVVWLVANGLVEPEQVLGLTFTRKAAGELAERVRSRLRGLNRAGLGAFPTGVGEGTASVQTYHSYAAGVLGDHSLRLGLEPGAKLLGEAGAWQLVDAIVQGWDGDMTGVDSARSTVVEAVLALAGECAEHLVEVGQVERLSDEMIGRITALPAELGGVAPGRPKPEIRTALEKLAARKALLDLVTRYALRKQELELLDFGDQVALAARLARAAPEVAAGERDRYRVVLLDEYQDTSHAQVTLLQSLFGAGHPVTAVGDPHQSIYAWRGASAGNLQRFGHDFPVTPERPAGVRELSTTWRNDRAVLAVANELAAPLRVPAPWSDPAAVVDVGSLAARPGAGPGAVRAEWHETVETEAAAVADWVAQLWRAPVARRPQIAVLCRARAQFPLLEAALRLRDLPVEVIGLGGLLHVPEVADLRAALEVVQDPGRGDSLMRLLTGAAWRLGPPDLDALGAWAKSLRGNRNRSARPNARLDTVDEPSLVAALDELPPPEWSGPAGQALTGPGRRRLERLGGVLRGLRARALLPLPELVGEAERALLLDVEVAARPGRSPAGARAHLDAFTDVAAGFADTGSAPTLGSFLSWLSAAEQQERGLDTGVGEQQEGAVQLLTVHGAKGLEWDAVAVTGLSEGTFPAGPGGRRPERSKAWLGELGALPYPLRGDAAGLPQWNWAGPGSQQQLADSFADYQVDCSDHEVAEERRLAYVAVTRARHRVLLTGALWNEGAKNPRVPSRFLEQVGALAGQLAGVSVGGWTTLEDGATNPLELEGRSQPWPRDPLGARRPAVEAGARLVAGAIAELEVPGLVAAMPADDEERAWAAEVELLVAERDAGRQARLGVPLPAHLSASRVVALATDPAGLALRLRRPMPEPPSPQARRGSEFHAWLERRFAAAALLDVEELPGAGDDAEPASDDPGELTRLQASFLASEWASRTAEAVEVAVETPVAGVVLRGRIDAVFASSGGGWDVVDWKTGARPSGDRARAAAVQLAVYRLAWSRLTGAPLAAVRAAFFYAGSGPAGETVRPVDLLDETGLEALLDVRP